MSQDIPLELKNVTKQFGKHTVLRDLELTVGRGESVALLGANGTGKSTLLSLACGLARPSHGSILAFGQSITSFRIKQHIGFMPQRPGLPDHLTVEEMIKLQRSYYKTPNTLDDLIEIVGIRELLGREARALSYGQQRRVAFALAISGDPDLLVLDEPSAGLDTQAKARLYDYLKARKLKGKSVLFTSHALEDINSYIDRVVLLKNGTITGMIKSSRIEKIAAASWIEFNNSDSTLNIEDIPHIGQICYAGGKISFVSNDPAESICYASTRGYPMECLTVRRTDMLDIFQVVDTANSAMNEPV